jgi:hypothetical protein
VFDALADYLQERLPASFEIVNYGVTGQESVRMYYYDYLVCWFYFDSSFRQFVARVDHEGPLRVFDMATLIPSTILLLIL